MASRTVTLYEDDLDGSEAIGTITFALEGVEYQIDLSEKNADKLRKALRPYVDAGRRVGGSRRRSAAESSGSGDTAAIREWAQEAGYEVSARGRISAAVREAYEAAH